MTEYNIYIVDLDTEKKTYLYTTVAENIAKAVSDPHVEFYKQEFGIARAAFNVIPTEDDDRNRDDLIFDFIIEEDDSTSSADSK